MVFTGVLVILDGFQHKLLMLKHFEHVWYYFDILNIITNTLAIFYLLDSPIYICICFGECWVLRWSNANLWHKHDSRIWTSLLGMVFLECQWKVDTSWSCCFGFLLVYTNKDAINHCLRSCANTISTHNECMRVWLAMTSTNGLNQFQKYVNAVYRKAQRHSGERQKKKKQKKRKKRKKKRKERKNTYEPLWWFTQRCQEQWVQRIVQRCERYVGKTGADGMGWDELADLFNIMSI